MCLAVPGRIEEFASDSGASPLEREGVIDFGGVRRRVSLAFVPEAVPGDYVLVHAGVAIQRLSPDSAAQTWQLLEAEVEGDSAPHEDSTKSGTVDDA